MDLTTQEIVNKASTIIRFWRRGELTRLEAIKALMKLGYSQGQACTLLR